MAGRLHTDRLRSTHVLGSSNSRNSGIKQPTANLVADAAVHRYTAAFWWSAGIYSQRAVVLNEVGAQPALRENLPEPARHAPAAGATIVEELFPRAEG